MTFNIGDRVKINGVWATSGYDPIYVGCVGTVAETNNPIPGQIFVTLDNDPDEALGRIVGGLFLLPEELDTA